MQRGKKWAHRKIIRCVCLRWTKREIMGREGGVNPGKVGHFSPLSQDKMLKRRDECTAGGQRKG